MLDSDSTSVPFKTAYEFVLNEDLNRLVLDSKLPRPSKFIEQFVSFCKAFCNQLTIHDSVKSNLLRGLSALDSSAILVSPENVYTEPIEKLFTHFVIVGLFSSSDKVKMVTQYRSFISKYLNLMIEFSLLLLITNINADQNCYNCLGIHVFAWRL